MLGTASPWLRWLLTVGLVMGLIGCANVNSVYRPLYAAEGQGALIDVKQRAILVGKREADSTGKKQEGNQPRQFVICAEPSPDALSAYAGEFAGKLAAAGPATSKAENLALQSAMREAASYVGMRTPSVQFLRDAMYRVCEAYSNGAIHSDQYELLMRRYQRQIVAMMAIEQLTQVGRVPNVALTTQNGMVSAGTRPLAEWISEIERQQAIAAQQQALFNDAARRAKTEAAAVVEAEEGAKKDGLLPADKAAADQKLASAQAALRAAEAAQRDAESQANRAQAHVAKLETLMTAGSTAMGGSSAAEVPGGSPAAAAPDQIDKVAPHVMLIVSRMLDADDTSELCFAHYSKEKPQDSPVGKAGLERMCAAYMGFMETLQTQRTEALKRCTAEAGASNARVSECLDRFGGARFMPASVGSVSSQYVEKTQK